MQTCCISICSRKFLISIFSSCSCKEVEHATPHPWRLSAWLASDKITINSPTCKKMIWHKGFQNVLLSPYKPANKWYRNEVRKESPPTRPLNSFTYLRAYSGKGVGQGIRDAWRPSGVWGSSATLQDLTGLCQPSASLCLSHNRETQTEQPKICGYTLGQSTLFANANSIVASCHPGTQKRMLIFTWTRTGPLYTSLWLTCSICTSKVQPIIEYTAGELYQRGVPKKNIQVQNASLHQ